MTLIERIQSIADRLRPYEENAVYVTELEDVAQEIDKLRKRCEYYEDQIAQLFEWSEKDKVTIGGLRVENGRMLEALESISKHRDGDGSYSLEAVIARTALQEGEK